MRCGIFKEYISLFFMIGMRIRCIICVVELIVLARSISHPIKWERLSEELVHRIQFDVVK